MARLPWVGLSHRHRRRRGDWPFATLCRTGERVLETATTSGSTRFRSSALLPLRVRRQRRVQLPRRRPAVADEGNCRAGASPAGLLDRQPEPLPYTSDPAELLLLGPADGADESRINLVNLQTLADIPIRSKAKRFLQLLLVVTRTGKDDDWKTRMALAQPFEQGQSVQARHIDVEHNRGAAVQLQPGQQLGGILQR